MGSQSIGPQLAIMCFLACAAVVPGCGGGSKVLKEPEPLTVTKPIAAVSDQHLTATLIWVIVRGGPGTWANNVDWDEYLMHVENQSNELIRVTNIVVLDSLGKQVTPAGTRLQLVNQSKEATRRYKDEGLKVEAGKGAESLMIAGGVMTAAAFAVGMSAMAGSTGALAASSAAAGAAILGPALLVAGAGAAIVKSNNQYVVDEKIRARQTLLPTVLPADHKKDLDIFFPLAPSPKQIEMTYVDSRGQHTLTIDTRAALNGLHLKSQKE
jgi:hypothetical protein